MRNVGLAVVASVLIMQCGPVAKGDDPACVAGGPPTRESVLEAGLTTLRVLREIEQAYPAALEDLRRLIDGTARSQLPADGSDLFAEFAASDPLPREGDPFANRGSYLHRRHGTGPPNRAAEAIVHGLGWLAAHQSPDGGWHLSEFDRWCDGVENTRPRPDGKGEAGHDVGVTGLALAAYLGMGYTWRGDREHVRTVARAIGFLRAQQREDGGFSPRTTADWILEDAFCALAVVEAYGMTGQQSLRPVAQRALDHLAAIRTPAGVWGCGWAPGPEDEHTTGWATLPFLSACHVNQAFVAEGLMPPLPFDAELLGTVAAWCERWSDTAGGTFAPRRPQTRLDTDSGTILTDSAIHLALPVLVRAEPPSPDARARMDGWLAARTPSWTPESARGNLSAWTFSALAAYRLGGDAKKAWTSAFHVSDSVPTALLNGQAKAGTYCGDKGSWALVDPRWAPWGRVGSTALMTLLLESSWYRYPPLPDVPVPR